MIMKKLCLVSAAVLLVLMCTNRQNPVNPRNNTWDSGSPYFSNNGKPAITARIDSLVWYDFDHATGLGTMKATYVATDPNLSKDTIFCRFFLGTNATPKREIFARSDSTLLLDNLHPKTMYRCSLSVVDSFGSSSFFILSFGTPVLFPPLPPRPSIASSGDTVKISWNAVASATGYRIYSADSGNAPFTLAAAVLQPENGTGTLLSQSFYFKNPASKYYIVASYNQGGESRSRDTLFGIIMSTEIAPPTVESVSKGTYPDCIKLTWHANDASAIAFEVYRSHGDTLSFDAIKRIEALAGQNTFTDSVPTTGNYFYKVAAINKQGYSSLLSASEYGYISRISNSPSLKIDATFQYIGLYWNPVAGAFRYVIYRNADSCGANSLPVDTTTLLFFNDSVLSADYFYYTIAAIDSMGTAGPLGNCAIGLLDSLPGPDGLQINNQTRPNALTLTWKTLPRAKSYVIFRSTSGCPDPTTGVYATTDSTIFIDTAVVSTSSYFYMVAAVDGKGRTGLLSECSNGGIKKLSSPENLVASNGTFGDYISLSWNALQGARSYVVYRSSVSCWESKTKIASPTANSFIDSVPTSNTYYYIVAGIDAGGAEGSPSACMQGWVTKLPAPLNLVASRGEYTDGIRLTWSTVAGATGYVVYSGTSSSVNAATVRATVTSPSYFDSTKTTATMYYWVAAANRLGTGLRSTYSYGNIISAPALSVSRYSSSVVLSWRITTGVLSGMTFVQRSNSSSGTFTVIDSTNGSTYSDIPADYNSYTYRVAVRLTSGTTVLSNTVIGYKLLPPPGGLKPTDKTGGCLLQWNRVPGITSYKIYRSETSATGALRATVNDTLYLDTVTTTIRYYYRVSAVNSDQESSTSGYVIGGVLQTPATPTAVRASGTANAINLYWDIPSGSSSPAGFYINRLNNQNGRYELFDSTTLTSYSDSVKDSLTYSYRIAAFNLSGTSAPSVSVSARLQPPAAPTLASVSLGLYSSYIRIAWAKVSGVDIYAIYRSTSTNGTYTSIGTTADTLFSDTSAVPNTRYYYRVSSIRKSIEGSRSGTISGLRLGPPATVTATPQLNGIRLSWTQSSVRVRMYYVYRATIASGPFTKIDSLTTSVYLDSNEAAANNYYRISASNLDETPPSATTDGVRRLFPEAPASVAATRGTDTSKITVTWDTMPGAQGYRIYRSMTDSFTTATLLGTSKTGSFVDTVPSDSFYYYRIKSYNISGESSLSAMAARGFRTPRIVPNAPVDLDTIDVVGIISLTWKMPSSTIAYTNFRIYRATSETGTYSLVDETSGTAFQDVPSSTFPTVYWYKLTAVNTKGESAASNIVSATRR